jgi:phage terminase large subunit GpA-like protein
MNTARRLLAQKLKHLKRETGLTPAAWAETKRRMTQAEGAFVGQFTFALTPWWRWFLERWWQDDVRKGVSQKSAQGGWSQSVVSNVLGYIAGVEKTTAIVMFSKTEMARDFDAEKFQPMVEATPSLRALIPTGSRDKNNTIRHKRFPGGWIKFISGRSIADVKSTTAWRLIVEEPDDQPENLQEQGDAIKLFEERGKTIRGLKILIGGTPSVEGHSQIESEMATSDGNHWVVPCPDCGEHQALEWEQVRWSDDAAEEHAVYGRARAASARYVCQHCGSEWSNSQMKAAAAKGHAQPSAPFNGVLGLYINDLYMPWGEASLQRLVEKYLEAKHEQDQKGELGAMIKFYNAQLGRAYKYKGETPDADELSTRGLNYAPLSVPLGGLLLTVGVDVQHDRLAIVIRAWGRGEESWLVLWDEISGRAVDPEDDVWAALDAVLFGTYRHEHGFAFRVRAATIDSGDGTTAEAVYSYVRSRTQRAKQHGLVLMAGKGASNAEAEIFARPKTAVDSNSRNTKASRFGLRPYQVGVSRAKDLILGDAGPGRLALDGFGPGRMHWYQDVRADYLPGLTSEVKIPKRGSKRKVWDLPTGKRNEPLDCEVYALHASRAAKVHLLREPQWQALEAQLRQQPLFDDVHAGELQLAGTDNPREPVAPARAAVQTYAQRARAADESAAQPSVAPAASRFQRSSGGSTKPPGGDGGFY